MIGTFNPPKIDGRSLFASLLVTKQNLAERADWTHDPSFVIQLCHHLDYLNVSNHSVDCAICGEDLRGLSGGHAAMCPDQGNRGVTYEQAKEYWRKYGRPYGAYHKDEPKQALHATRTNRKSSGR